MRRMMLVPVLSLLCIAGCTNASTPSEALRTKASRLAHDRSLAVTQLRFLEPFSLERVLDQVVQLSGVPGLTADDLFRQLWDTQNPAPGLMNGTGPFCDTLLTWQNVPGLNDHPWFCPRLEGQQADANVVPNPLDPADPLYIPIGLFNRFDLAPANGVHCGEYRIVYAMRPGHPQAIGNGRNFIIFEAILPNPNPHLGLQGCRPIAQMWHDFSFMPDAVMAQLLEDFYFNGVHGFPPVVHPHHFGMMLGAEGYGCSSGQIRTNQFLDAPWVMREYKLALDCRCAPCDLRFIPMTVKTNPYADLFSAATLEPAAPMLPPTLAGGVFDLVHPDPNQISYRVPDILNAAESVVDPSDDYAGIAAGNTSLLSQIASVFPAGFAFTPLDIVERALTQSCAGCHELSNGRHLGAGLHWPPSLGFVHIDEHVQPNGHYPISQALQGFFLPFREKIILDYLATPPDALPPGGDRCHLELPPELQVPPPLCDPHGDGGSGGGSDDGDVVIEVPFRVLELLKHPELLRDLRVRWEGDAILGRRSAH